MIRRKILIGLLGLGTLVGYGSGIASMRHHCSHRHSEFEKRVAHVCAEAAQHPEQAPTAEEAYHW